MIVYNVSKNKVNFSQRNNVVNPFRSCNTTAMIMAASYMPKVWSALKESDQYKKYATKFEQPEDCFQQYMLDNNLRPTVHTDLCKAFNDFLGYNIASFSMNTNFTRLIDEIKIGHPVVISGDFPKKDGGVLGHIVCLVGVKFNSETDRYPSHWIIDDPYGDTLNNWQGSGNDIELPHQYFLDNIKNKGQLKKWAHVFKSL